MRLFPQSSSLAEYPESDGFRGIAILLVFGFHYLIPLLNTVPPNHNPLLVILYSGAYGVQLFFVLSAYLLFRPQYQRLITGERQTPIRHFLLRRFLRIAPLYYLGLLAYSYWFEPQFLDEKRPHLFAHLLFVQNFFPDMEYSILNVAWSLGIEFLFYISLAGIVTWLFLIRSMKHCLRILLYPLSAVLLMAVVLMFSLQAPNVPQASPMSFLCGLSAAIITTHLPQFKYAKPLLALLGLVATAGIFIMQWQITEISYFKIDSAYDPAFRSFLPLVNVCYATLIIVAAQRDALFYPLLAWLPLRIIGLFSYEIYLIHKVAIDHVAHYFPYFEKIQATSHALAVTCLFIAVLLVGGCLHFLISRPFIVLSRLIIHKA